MADQIEIERRAVKHCAAEFLRTLEAVGARTSKTRELSLAKTKVEEAELWALRHLELLQ